RARSASWGILHRWVFYYPFDVMALPQAQLLSSAVPRGVLPLLLRIGATPRQTADTKPCWTPKRARAGSRTHHLTRSSKTAMRSSRDGLSSFSSEKLGLIMEVT